MLADNAKLFIHRYPNRRKVIYTGLGCSIPDYDIVIHKTEAAAFSGRVTTNISPHGAAPKN
jgi:hypothetical protein